MLATNIENIKSNQTPNQTIYIFLKSELFDEEKKVNAIKRPIIIFNFHNGTTKYTLAHFFSFHLTHFLFVFPMFMLGESVAQDF